MPSSTSGSNNSDTKLRNQSAVLLSLLRHDGISRVRLAEQLGVSSTTITNVVNELRQLGIVSEKGKIRNDEPRVGRPQKALYLVPESRYAIGVQFGVQKVRIAITNLCGEIINFSRIAFELHDPIERVLSQVVTAIQSLIDDSGIDRQKLVGVGVAASGLVDVEEGVNLTAPRLGWRNIPMRDYFQDRLGLPVFVDNNVRAMILGESFFGKAQDVHAAAFVYVSTGVGAGLVVGGELHRGASAGAGEIGHMNIIPHGGSICSCGDSGCLETLISRAVLLSQGETIIQDEPNSILANYAMRHGNLSLEMIFAAAEAGDPMTQDMLNTAGEYLGIALANLVNIFNPELILLGGLFIEEREQLLPIVRETLRKRAFADLGQQVRVEITEFGDRVGMIGACALALDNFFYRPLSYPEFNQITA